MGSSQQPAQADGIYQVKTKWKQLEMAIGMSQSETDKEAFDRGTNEGTKLKATSGWNNNGNGTDDFGFSALPGGNGYDGSFRHIGNYGFWWSSTEVITLLAWHRYMNNNAPTVARSTVHEGRYQSIRCVVSRKRTSDRLWTMK